MDDLKRLNKELECQREVSIAHSFELNKVKSIIKKLLVFINLLEDYRASFIDISSHIPSGSNKNSLSLDVKAIADALLRLETLALNKHQQLEAQPPPLHHALLEASPSGLLHIINRRTKDDLTAATILLTELEDKAPNINITTSSKANIASTALRQHQIDSYESTKQLENEVSALKDRLQYLIKAISSSRSRSGSGTIIPEKSIMRAGLLGITQHISSQLDYISGAEATIKATKQSIKSVEQEIKEAEAEEERLDKLLSKLARKDEQLLTSWKDHSSQAQEISSTIKNSSEGEDSFGNLAILLHNAIYNELEALSGYCDGSYSNEEEEGGSSPNNNNNNLIPHITNQGLADTINRSNVELSTKLSSLESWKAISDLVNATLIQVCLLVDDGLEAEAEQFRMWQHKEGVDDLRRAKQEAVHAIDVTLRKTEQALHDWWASPIVEAISWLKYDGKNMGQWMEGGVGIEKKY
jgi:hypothetical protein